MLCSHARASSLYCTRLHRHHLVAHALALQVAAAEQYPALHLLTHSLLPTGRGGRCRRRELLRWQTLCAAWRAIQDWLHVVAGCSEGLAEWRACKHKQGLLCAHGLHGDWRRQPRHGQAGGARKHLVSTCCAGDVVPYCCPRLKFGFLYASARAFRAVQMGVRLTPSTLNTEAAVFRHAQQVAACEPIYAL